MRTRIKIMVLASLFLLACVSVASAGDITAGYASDSGIIPVLIDGNPMTCTDMGCSGEKFVKIELAEGADYTGTYGLGNGKTIRITTTSKGVISWTSNVDINCIFMKGGNGGDSYCYGPGVRSDSGLSTPIDTKNNQPKGISHINICFTPEIPVPEFPVGIIPAFLIGLIGLVFFIREYR